MTSEAQRLAVEFGASVHDAAAHRSRFLTERDLATPHLVLAMSREHRRRVVELAPSRMRRTFTAREFARLAEDLSDDEIRSSADEAGTDVSARMQAAVAAVASRRGIVVPPADPADDDVIDPYRRSWDTYQLSAAQLLPGIDQVARVLTVASR